MQFGIWLGPLLEGDLGTSIYSGLPVAQLISQRLEPTITLTLLTMIIAIGLAIPLGTLAAWKAGTWVDRGVMIFAKGVKSGTVLIRHALKNAALPVVTIVGVGFALLVSGAVAIESVFAIPGLGRLTMDAILHRDYPVIQGMILVVSAVYVLINLLIDLSYAVLDPRIRY